MNTSSRSADTSPRTGRGPPKRTDRPACRSSSRSAWPRPRPGWSSRRRADRARVPAEPPPTHRRACGCWATAGSPPTAARAVRCPRFRRRCPRNRRTRAGTPTGWTSVAWSPTSPRRPRPAAVPGSSASSPSPRFCCGSAISPRTWRPVVTVPPRGPKTTCGTTCSTCRRGGCVRACRSRTAPARCSGG